MRTTKVVKGVKLGFDWQGGEYVDVCLGEAFASSTFDVINVTDADGNRPELTRGNFHAIINTWLFEYGKEALISDMRAGGII